MTVDARTNDVDLSVPIQPTSSENRFEIINIVRGYGARVCVHLPCQTALNK
jgi:hypothetical protein